MGKLTFSELEVGMTSKRSYQFSEEKVKTFANLVDDHAPVHEDPDFAKNQGFNGKIVHGLYVQSIISGILGNEIPGPKSVINQISMKMHAPVVIGETVDYEVQINALTPSVGAVSLNFSGKIGETQIISGKALCSFPNKN